MYQQITLIGYLGNAPEMRFAPSGDAVTSFSIAAGRSWVDANGEKKDKTVWFRVSIWGKQAEPVAQYLRKGSKAQVVGEIEPARVFTDKSGVTRASLEVKAQNVIFLDSKGDSDGGPVTAGKAPAPALVAEPEDHPF